ncbi:alanine racemase [Alcanivorax sp. N3-2A]|nr:alanine racemase [Alcanivorax sp. N3-2A]
MKRRTFLVALAGGAVFAWWLKPGDQGAPYTPYFQALNRLLREQGPGRPVVLIDRQRLAANCERLIKALPTGRALRIVAKSLPSLPLIREVMALTGSHRVMVFHQPFINALAEAEPDCDLLLGKPMPVNAAALFYKVFYEVFYKESSQKPAGERFDPQRQLQWLIDTRERLSEYLRLAQGLHQRLRVNLEIDVGLHRGGLTDPAQLDELIAIIHAHPQHLELAGLMGYDAHVGKLPAIVESRQQSHRKAQVAYQGFIDHLYRRAPHYRDRPLTFNGAGSPTILLHGDETPLNELSAGSCLLKPSDFDLESLSAFQPAVFVAAPVLKHLTGLHLPGPLPVGQAWALWNPNRRETYFIYGGYWKATPVSPAGITANKLYGVSTNQMMYNGSPASALTTGDMIFFRPTQSESVLLQFGNLLALGPARHGDFRVHGAWAPLPQGAD